MNNNNEINNFEKSYELIKFEDGDFSLDVNVSPNEDTVWLTQAQMAKLYDVNRQAITKHIQNIIQDNELDNSTCSILEQVKMEGDRLVKRTVNIYNLDMTISVGYRVNSKRGIMFRRWANFILKQYLIKGYVINEPRCIAHSDNLVQINNSINSINDRLSNVELRLDNITSIDVLNDKLFYDSQYFEGYVFIKNLFSKANNRIIIIDNYLDYSVLEMLNDVNVEITIYICDSTPITNREINLFQQTHNLIVIRTNKYHDRFIIIDNELYNVGSSIKDIGKKISHISKLEDIDINNLLNIEINKQKNKPHFNNGLAIFL